MRLRFTFNAFLISLALGSLVPGQGSWAAESARSQLEAFLAGTDTYAANFEQTLTDEQGGVVEESTGQFWLQRPGRFRWHYDAPLERELVSDGTKIWLYDVELDQVTVRAADGALEQTPAGILVGAPGALDNYILSLRDENLPGTRVGLQPKAASGEFEDIVLEFSDGILQGLTLKDRFGQTTRIVFAEGQRNPELNAARFSFIVPAGADVIDQTL